MPNNALTSVEEYLAVNFIIKDWEGVRLIFGAAAALYCPGEMLWLRIVGASRSGRTELLRPIQAHKDSEPLEALTPSAIRGGLKKPKGKRLLQRLKGKRAVTLDLAAVLTTRKDVRNEIFGLLRPVKDGQISSDFGSDEGHLLQETRFDWLIATTPVFEQSRVMEGLLGERFIDLWWIPADREEMAIQAVENNPKLKQIRKKLAQLVGTMLDQAEVESKNAFIRVTAGKGIGMLDSLWLGKVGNIASLLRSPILKDRQGNIISLPQPEVGTDLAQGFQKVALGLQLIGIDDYKPYIKRLAKDCMPSIRKKLVTALFLVPDDDPRTISKLGARLTLPESTVKYHLVDLEALGAVVKSSDKYELRDKSKVGLMF